MAASGRVKSIERIRSEQFRLIALCSILFRNYCVANLIRAIPSTSWDTAETVNENLPYKTERALRISAWQQVLGSVLVCSRFPLTAPNFAEPM
jgi:hypothetical protein